MIFVIYTTIVVLLGQLKENKVNLDEIDK